MATNCNRRDMTFRRIPNKLSLYVVCVGFFIHLFVFDVWVLDMLYVIKLGMIEKMLITIKT